MKPAWPCHGLYAITPDEVDTGRLLSRVESVLSSAPCLLQYRNKQADATLRRRQAEALQSLCRRYQAPLLINDDWRLAAELAADGVHLGEGDGEIEAARATLGPDAIIGASCYDRLERATAAVAAGASYVAFGAFFPSSTKPFARQASLQLLRDAESLGVPRVAIGGIRPDNAGILVEAGADMLAVISGVFDADDPCAAARAYTRLFARDAAARAPYNGDSA